MIDRPNRDPIKTVELVDALIAENAQLEHLTNNQNSDMFLYCLRNLAHIGHYLDLSQTHPDFWLELAMVSYTKALRSQNELAGLLETTLTSTMTNNELCLLSHEIDVKRGDYLKFYGFQQSVLAQCVRKQAEIKARLSERGLEVGDILTESVYKNQHMLVTEVDGDKVGVIYLNGSTSKSVKHRSASMPITDGLIANWYITMAGVFFMLSHEGVAMTKYFRKLIEKVLRDE